MKIFKLLIISLLLFLVTGSYEDKGNYDYSDINEISLIDFQTEYELTILETLKIEPKINFLLNDDNISYTWKNGTKEIIGEEKNLNFTIPGDWKGIKNLLFIVKDNNTGLSIQKAISLTVKQPYSTGYLILSEKDGKSSLSFLRRDYVEKDGDYIEVTKEFFDIYKNGAGEALGTEPLRIFEHGRSRDYENNKHILVVQKGGQGCVDLIGENLSKSLETKKEFMNLPNDYAPKDVLFAEEYSFILNEDGRVFSRKNISDEAYYSGYFSDYPMSYKKDGKLIPIKADCFVHGLDYESFDFIMVYEKVNSQFLLISDFKNWNEDESGQILSLEADVYDNSDYIPLHNTGDNEHVCSFGYRLSDRRLYRKESGLYNIFKTSEGKYIEQHFRIKFDKYGSGAVTITPINVREFPDGYLDQESVINVPDGGKYGSSNIFISKGNTINYYNRVKSGEIDFNEYFTFDSKVVAIDDKHYTNKTICVGLENGDVYLMDISTEAIAGIKDKVLYKTTKGVGDIKQIIYKRGR